MDARRYGVEYHDEHGELIIEYFASYEEAKAEAEELSTYYEVLGILR